MDGETGPRTGDRDDVAGSGSSVIDHAATSTSRDFGAAEETSQQGTPCESVARRAFLWGSNGNSGFALKYAKEDPRSLASVLSAPRYGFQVEVFEKTDDPHDVHRALRTAAGHCTASDTFLAYFAGHGILIDNRLYFGLDRSDPRRHPRCFLQHG